VTGSIDDEFLTVADIVAILKLDQRMASSRIDQRTFPALHIGRRGDALYAATSRRC
jgi:hypothetical protein